MSERRTLAISAVVMGASIPGFAVVFALWARNGLSQTDSFDPLKVAAFAAQNPVLYGVLPIIGIVMHLAALLLVIGLHRRLVEFSPLWVTAGSALGFSWVFADLLQNLMHYGIFLGTTAPEVVAASNRTVDALWHAGHLGGGIWVLTVAAAGGSMFGRAYRMYCVVAGAFFGLHPLIFPLAPWWFNVEFLLVPVWGFWTAAAIGRSAAFSR